MSNYARANTTAAWYQDNYPGADLHLTEETEVVCLHTTETTSLPGYSGGSEAPTYTAPPDFDAEQLRWFGHFPDEKSSRALVNAPGGVETNTLNVVQVELVGTCDPATAARWRKAGITRFIYWPDPPAWAVDSLAEFLADQHRRHGLRLVGPPHPFVAYPDSYGSGPQRMTYAQWRTFAGVCGHQSVPENYHGDPGALPLAKVLDRAKALVTPQPVSETPRWDAVVEATDELLKFLAQGDNPARTQDARDIRRIAAHWSKTF